MSAADFIAEALRGEGPVFEAMLDQRARELAVAPELGGPAGDMRRLLILSGANGARWALDLAEVARVEVLPPVVAVPTQGTGILGLAMLAGRRCLVVDLDAMAAGAPLRSAGRGGHAVVLRHAALALVVDRAEEITSVPAVQAPQPGDTGFGLLGDGTVLIDAQKLAAKAIPQGGGG